MSWSTVALGELVTFKGGGTPSRDNPAYWGGSIPWATVKDLNSGYSLRSTKEFITEAGLQRSASNLISAGTVIVPTRMALGKAVMAEMDVAINQDLKAATPVKELDQRYLLWFFLANSARIEAMGKGATVKGVTLDQLRSLELPLPPLSEQRRIAAILDKADALRAKRREAIAKLDQLLQSVFLDMFGDPILNPKGWRVASLKDAGCFVQIGPFGSLLHKSDYVHGGVPLINPMHIIDGSIKPGIEQAVLQEKAEALGSYRLREGDVIMGRRGEMGRCAVVTSTEAGMLCGTGSLLVRPPSNVFTAKFLLKVLSSPSMKRHLEELSQGVTMPNLNSTLVENLEVVLPPLDLQRRYEKFVKRADMQRNRLHSWVKRQETLFASLQHRAFSGTL